LNKIRLAAMHADSIADAANVAKANAAMQAELKATLTMPITFDPQGTAVRFDASAPLDHKVAVLIKNPAVSLRITGHAYELQTAKENTALGMARAESAKHYMVIQGIAPTRIQTAAKVDVKPAGAVDDSLTAQRSDEFEITSAPPMLQNP
jgi:peptidoglycan-associated lipoprotein